MRPAVGADRIQALLDQRTEANETFFAAEADRLARFCHLMAERFARGGRLIAIGSTAAARTDVRHVAVEFVHPVIVGKRALPAISLTADIATVTGLAARDGMGGIFAHQVHCLARPADIALGICTTGNDESVLRGLVAAHDLGMLTIALAGGDGGAIGASPAVDHLLVARSADPQIVKEVHVTAYHLLWELVHVFFEQPGVLDPEVVG
jgi:D-sedoheptulose 7-phosphate isomerase